MDPSPEHIPKQASHTKPAIVWDVDELLEWIQHKRPTLLDDAERETLRTAGISGEVFLGCAGDMSFFHDDCKLPAGPSLILAKLARGLAKGETAGVMGKSLSFIPCTPRRQQANVHSKETTGWRCGDIWHRLQKVACRCRS
jgi:hypothetical protein